MRRRFDFLLQVVLVLVIAFFSASSPSVVVVGAASNVDIDVDTNNGRKGDDDSWTQKEEISQFLDSFGTALRHAGDSKDDDTLRAHFARGAVVHVAGASSSSEKAPLQLLHTWNVPTFSQRLRSHSLRETARSASSSLPVSSSTQWETHGNMAWFEHDVVARWSGEVSRHHGVLLRRNDDWNVMEYNITEAFLRPKGSASDAIASRSFASHRNDSLELSIMTFNIRYGTADDGDNSWPYRRDQLFALIERHNPQLVGLQEALLFQLEEITAALPHYTWIGVGRDDGVEAGEFAAILYRPTEFEVLEEGTYWFCDNPSEPGCTSYGNTLPRISTWGLFEHLASGYRLYMENVHLDHMSVESREKSATQLVEHVYSLAGRGYPFVITGDFNCATEESSEIVQVKEAGFNDSFRVLYPDATGVGTIHSFTGTTENTKIDYVFTPAIADVGGPAEILYAEIIHDNVDGAYPSDHFPVKATVVFPPLAAAKKPIMIPLLTTDKKNW